MQREICTFSFLVISYLCFSQQVPPDYQSREIVEKFIVENKVEVLTKFNPRKNFHTQISVKNISIRINSLAIYYMNDTFDISYKGGYAFNFKNRYSFNGGRPNIYFFNSTIIFAPRYSSIENENMQHKMNFEIFSTHLKKLYNDYEEFLKGNVDPFHKEHADSLLLVFQTRFNESKKTKGSLEVSEEQRRYIVQANAANEGKQYKLAIELFNKAVSVNEFAYPAAYYNMALLNAQLGKFYEATFSMKKYLIAAPDAADARKAKDKIYEWELNIKQ